MFSGTALAWYETMRLSYDDPTWAFWRAEICKKFGHSAWRRKKQAAFDADKFIPGETEPAQWVTRQVGRLKCFDANADRETVNFKMMTLMEGEVEYAVKSAMSKPDADLSEFINILEDICDKTRIGRRRFQSKSQVSSLTKPAVQSGTKPIGSEKEKSKPVNPNIKCYTCGETGHTSRRCSKTVNAVK